MLPEKPPNARSGRLRVGWQGGKKTALGRVRSGKNKTFRDWVVSRLMDKASESHC